MFFSCKVSAVDPTFDLTKSEGRQPRLFSVEALKTPSRRLTTPATELPRVDQTYV
jgi:hypothetical protein